MLEVAMLADVSGAYNAISIYVWLCPSDISLCTWLWLVNINFYGAAFESWKFVMDYELRCQFNNILYLF